MPGNPGEERTVSVELAGSLDISHRAQIAALLPAPENIDRIVIDCTNADFIDSTIISAFMRYRRAFMEAGGDPLQIIIVVNPNLRRIFEIAGLSSSVTVVSASGGPPANRGSAFVDLPARRRRERARTDVNHGCRWP